MQLFAPLAPLAWSAPLISARPGHNANATLIGPARFATPIGHVLVLALALIQVVAIR